MDKILKQAVGIDCAKADFVACFGQLANDFEVVVKATKTFKNNAEGFAKLQQWAGSFAGAAHPVHFVMEATGVYYEKLACHLADSACPVSVVLPQRAKSFSKTLKTKTVTDKEASKFLTVMALEKKLDLWQKPGRDHNLLKQLTREREQLQKQLTEVKNQFHAENAGAWPNKNSLARMGQHKKLLQKQVAAVDADIAKAINNNPALKSKVKNITTIPGVGVLTAATVIGETNGFCLIRNKRQLVSYAGYDVVEKQSGTSVRGKAKISHRGNRHIRKAMHLPALCSIRVTDHSKALFTRLVGRHGIKMKAAVAVQRKMLVLIYTLWKNDEVYEAGKAEAAPKKSGQPLIAALA